MEVSKTLHMNSGVGVTSYAKNSLLQRKAISIAWPIMKEAIEDFYTQNFPSTDLITMADLGCSSGPNALIMVSNFIKQIEEIRKTKYDLKNPILQYQIFLNDLPSNDFNQVFRSLPNFIQNLKTQLGYDEIGPCFFHGVPSSFHGRLFPNNTLHFVHSSYSLHWLSQIPEEVLKNNKGNIFINHTSPKKVVEGYYKQFEKDFTMFLKCRGEEVVNGGRMVVTILGRTSTTDHHDYYCYALTLLNLAFKNMVAEGIVEEEKVDSFNIPNFMPSGEEVKAVVLKEGSFSINELQLSGIDWNLCDNNTQNDKSYNIIAKCIRSVMEPILIPHFGEHIIDNLFCRYRKIVEEQMSIKKIEFINLTFSLTKKLNL